MRKKLFFGLVCVSFFGAFLLSMGVCVTPTEAKTYEFTYSNMFPPTHIQNKVPQAWADEIEKRSNGQIKIKIFAGGSLTPAPQIYNGVVKGISDFGLSAFPYTPGRFPVMSVIDNPFGYKDGFVTTNVINEVYKRFKPKELDDVHVCYLFSQSPGFLHTARKPVHKLEDLKGLKVRSTGTSQLIVRALGATPVAMPQGETYDALKKNIVDATLVPLEALEGYKQAEVLKYTTLTYICSYGQGFHVSMNLDKWNALPKDLQEIITDVSKEYIHNTAQAWEDSDESARQFAKKLGHEFITLSDEELAKFKKAVQPVFDGYIESMNGKGFDGKTILEATREMVEKYNQ
jgi:TRAP-type C4-dicarboxylate transport system substrate-binding protein